MKLLRCCQPNLGEYRAIINHITDASKVAASKFPVLRGIAESAVTKGSLSFDLYPSFESKLARPFSEKAPFGNSQPRDGTGIGRIRSHCVSPPVEGDSVVAQREENDDRRDSSASIHRCLEQIYVCHELVTFSRGIFGKQDLTVITLPPVKRTLADQVVEQKADDEPEGVLGYLVRFT